jgi:hypothetical protein
MIKFNPVNLIPTVKILATVIFVFQINSHILRKKEIKKKMKFAKKKNSLFLTTKNIRKTRKNEFFQNLKIPKYHQVEIRIFRKKKTLRYYQVKIRLCCKKTNFFLWKKQNRFLLLITNLLLILMINYPPGCSSAPEVLIVNKL